MLLEAVYAPDAPAGLADLEAVGGVAGDLDPAVGPRRRPGALAGSAGRPAARQVEALTAQACRLCDLHRARYRGLAKTHLQHVLAALALDLVRVDAWLTGTSRTGSWTSRLARLAQPLPAT